MNLYCSFRGQSRAVFLLFSAFLLGSCSGSVDTDILSFLDEKTPLPCPRVEVLPGADAITIFREGEGRDLVDVRYEGVLEPAGGTCIYEDDDVAVVVDLNVRIGAVRGPAATSQIEEFPFFVAIAKKTGEIIAKEIFISPIEIPEGFRRGVIQEEMQQRIPLPGLKTGADYIIIVGFQLTKEQIELNR